MGVFDTNIVEQPLTLSSYAMFPGADNKVEWQAFYKNIFKDTVLFKYDGDSRYWVGVHGVIEQLGELPIDCLTRFNIGDKTYLLNALKSYVNNGVRISVVQESNKFKLRFKSPVDNDICVINIYTR